jgi:hypothetical protein
MGQLFLSCGWHGKVGRCRKAGSVSLFGCGQILGIFGSEGYTLRGQNVNLVRSESVLF